MRQLTLTLLPWAEGIIVVPSKHSFLTNDDIKCPEVKKVLEEISTEAGVPCTIVHSIQDVQTMEIFIYE